MDFIIDMLVPFIFLIIWALFTFGGNKKKVKFQKPYKKEKKNNQVSSFFDNIQKSVEEIIKENELSVPFQAKTSAINNTKEKTIKKGKISQPVEVSEKKSVQSADNISSDIYKLKMKTEKGQYQKLQPAFVKRDFSVKKLQEAIIWSEILAKPLSLRDENSIDY
ncbi:MAG: hypothetical protein PVI26_04650 [Chitinispirillia bacterium]|jgi:hypothetical protein